MFARLRQPHRPARFGVAIASSAILVLGLCSCQTSGDLDVTGSLGDKTEASRATDPRRDLDTYRERLAASVKRVRKQRINSEHFR